MIYLVYQQVDREVTFGNLLLCERRNRTCRCISAIPAPRISRKILTDSVHASKRHYTELFEAGQCPVARLYGHAGHVETDSRVESAAGAGRELDLVFGTGFFGLLF